MGETTSTSTSTTTIWDDEMTSTDTDSSGDDSYRTSSTTTTSTAMPSAVKSISPSTSLSEESRFIVNETKVQEDQDSFDHYQTTSFEDDLDDGDTFQDLDRIQNTIAGSFGEYYDNWDVSVTDSIDSLQSVFHPFDIIQQ